MQVRSRSKAAAIEARLRERIDTGAYLDGRLPTVRELIAEFGVAKGTMDTVLARLEAAGALIRVHGSGLYVRQRIVVERNLLGDVLTEYRLAAAGRAGEAGLFEQVTGHDVVVQVSYDRQPADPRVAAMLQIDVGAPVLQRTFRFVLSGVAPASPHQLAYGWMPAELADKAGLTDPAAEQPGVGTMAQLISAGVTLGLATRRVEARMPTPAETAELAIPPGTPVFELQRRLWQAKPRPVPVEFGLQVVPADRVAYVLDVDLQGVKP